MFDLREREVVPLYFDRSEGRLPRRWVRRMKSTLASTGPFVSASRMVKDYTTDLYEPAAAHDDDMAADGHRRSRQIAAWKERRSEEHTSELQSLMRISYAVFCFKKKFYFFSFFFFLFFLFFFFF